MEQWEQKVRAVLNLCRPVFKWIAMDKSGDWYVYINKPKAEIKNEWWGNENHYYLGQCLDLDPAPSWKNSLIERSE